MLFQYNSVLLIKKKDQNSPKYNRKRHKILILLFQSLTSLVKTYDIKAVTSTTPTVYFNTVSYFLFL